REAEAESDRIQAPWSGAALRRVIVALVELLRGRSKPDWDGYGANALDALSLSLAVRLLGVIPSEMPPTEIGVDSDCDVSLEWYRDPQHVFSISVAPDGTLSYAGIAGRSSAYGRELSFDEDLPPMLRARIRRVVNP